MVGEAHERRVDGKSGKSRERRQAWKKGSWQRHIPVPLSNVSAPGVFTNIYLKLITSYAHISGLLKWRPVGQIQPPGPFLFGLLITSLNIERHRAMVFIWPSDMYLELSLALYGLPEKIIENPCHILLIVMLYFDRIIQDLKLSKQKYVYK